jgi:hypothetical protein
MTARVNNPVLDQENPSVLKFDDVIAVRTTATAGSGAMIDSFGGVQITSLG